MSVVLIRGPVKLFSKRLLACGNERSDFQKVPAQYCHITSVIITTEFPVAES